MLYYDFFGVTEAFVTLRCARAEAMVALVLFAVVNVNVGATGSDAGGYTIQAPNPESGSVR